VEEEHRFQRLELITGSKGLDAIRQKRIIIFGIGGVGSWAAEALVRSAIRDITIVDSDTVCLTNINRQIPATSLSVGKPKVDVLAERLLAINPEAAVTKVNLRYNRDTAAQFNLNDYDYVVDAIDSLGSKVELIINALNADTKLFSSLGAARKLDPTRIKIGDIWETRGCRLGHFVRKRLRKRGIKAGFTCVYSDELMALPDEFSNLTDLPNGSAAAVTGCFGLHLCSLIIRDILLPFKEIRPLS